MSGLESRKCDGFPLPNLDNRNVDQFPALSWEEEEEAEEEEENKNKKKEVYIGSGEDLVLVRLVRLKGIGTISCKEMTFVRS